MAIEKLTAAKVKNAKPGRYSDGGGLVLAVGANSRSWVFRYMMPGGVSSRGKRLSREMGIGSVQDIGLAAAREKARQLRAMVHRKPEDGGPIDPLEERKAKALEQATSRAKGVLTFQKVAEDYLAANSGSWKNQKHRAQWPSTLATYVYPVIGHLPVKAIDRDLVVKVLRPIWHDKAETARRVRMRIEKVMDAAIARNAYDGANPAIRGPLKTLLGEQTDEKEHQKAIPYKDAREFMVKLRAKGGVGAEALEFLILAATRDGETRKAEWSEIDRKARLWNIPATHRKGKKGKELPLTVPLSDRALQILDAVAERDGETGLIFKNPRGRRLSENTLNKCVKDLGYDATAHGMRSMFSDWRGDVTDYPEELAEHALGHAVKGVKGDYRRQTAPERRRPLMEDWARFLDTPWEQIERELQQKRRNVLPFRGAA